MKPKTDLEEELSEYYYAIKDLRQYEVELAGAIRMYKESVSYFPGHDYNAIRIKNKKIAKPVEAAVILLVDTIGLDIEDIKRKISGAQRTINRITSWIEAACLNGLEKDYVQYRYFEGRSVEMVYSKMNGIGKTLGQEIRSSALEKIERVKNK